MDLFIIKNAKELKEVKIEKEKMLSICFDWLTKRELVEKGLKAQIYDEYISETEGDTTDRFVFNLSKEWHYFKGEDFTTFQGVSLGLIWEWVFWWSTLIPMYKFLISIKSILNTVKPITIFCDNEIPNAYSWILKELANKNRSKVECFGAPKKDLGIDVLSGSCSGWELNSRVYRWRRPFFIVYNFVSRLRNIHKDNESNVLVFPYPTLTNLFLEWQRKSQGINFLTTSLPRKTGISFFFRKLPECIFLYPRRLLEEEELSLLRIKQRWDYIKRDRDYINKFTYNDLNLFPVLQCELEYFFNEKIFSLAQDVVGYKDILGKKSVKCILLPFDVSPTNSTIIQVAKTRQIPTIVMLHGLPCISPFNDRDNLQTDYLFVWGIGEYDHYLPKKGKDKLRLVGNPYFDYYKQNRIDTQNQNRRKRVLLLSNPIVYSFISSSAGDPEEYLMSLIEILSEFDVEIIIKLHPSESLNYYKSILQKPGIKILKDEPIKELIAWSDVVICSFTTVLLEALICEKPVVYVNFSKVRCSAPFNGKDNFPITTTKEEVRNQIKQVLSGRTEGLQHLYKKVLEDYAGPLDNRSSERVLKEISQIISNEIEREGKQ